MKIEKAKFNFIDMHNMYTCTNVKIQKETLKIWLKFPNLIHALILKIHFLKVLHQTKKESQIHSKNMPKKQTCTKIYKHNKKISFFSKILTLIHTLSFKCI